MWCEGAVQGNTEGVEGHRAQSQRQFGGAEWNIGSVLELAGQSAAALRGGGRRWRGFSWESLPRL